MYIGRNNRITELTDNSGTWNFNDIDMTGGLAPEKIVVANGRNNGVQRLYAAIDKSVIEFSWINNNWVSVDCGQLEVSHLASSDLIEGKARNDDKTRLYVATIEGLFEVYYDEIEQKWKHDTIITGDRFTTLYIGKARNDDLNHLFAVHFIDFNSNEIIEYSFSGTWTKTSGIVTDYIVNDIIVGNGRNDGTQRIYTVGENKHIYEYSY